LTGGKEFARPRARDLGIIIGRLPTGRYNCITDVKGVKVGHVTLIRGEGKLIVGKGPVRTGVTAIVPVEGDVFELKPAAAVHVINAYGKFIGATQVQELGQIETPIIITNTLSVWTAANSVVDYFVRQGKQIRSVNPVVLECNDGFLNDILGRHVRERHIIEAIEGAHGGAVEEGNAGAGTGMCGFGYKAGVGTSSRRVGRNHVGVLVVTNTGRAGDLRIDGFPLDTGEAGSSEGGSIAIVIGTDAPMDSRQLLRLAKRAALGLGRAGGMAHHGSGDYVIAFSSASTRRARRKPLPDEALDDYFRAVVEATEEAILNSLFRAETMVGRDGNRAEALPIERVIEITGRLTTAR